MPGLDDHCDINCIHEENVKHVRSRMISHEVSQGLAEFFKALGDPTRVRVIFALLARELCVCDLAAVLDMGDSAVSHQLRVLRNQRLVKYRREGKVVYYSLDDEHISVIVDCGLTHLNERGGFSPPAPATR